MIEVKKETDGKKAIRNWLYKRKTYLSIVAITLLVECFLLVYFIKSTSNEISQSLLIASVMVVIFMGGFIKVLHDREFKFENPYYSFFFTLISTILGFTIATSGQEYLNDREDKKDLKEWIEITLDNYKEQEKKLVDFDFHEMPKDTDSAYGYVYDAYSQVMVAKYASSEPIYRIMNQYPDKLKDLSQPVRKYISNSLPLDKYYEPLDMNGKWDYSIDGKFALDYAVNYRILKDQISIRKSLLESELNLINGKISKSKHEKEMNSLLSQIEKYMLTGGYDPYAESIGTYFDILDDMKK